jgi:hypothetical protein
MQHTNLGHPHGGLRVFRFSSNKLKCSWFSIGMCAQAAETATGVEIPSWQRKVSAEFLKCRLGDLLYVADDGHAETHSFYSLGGTRRQNCRNYSVGSIYKEAAPEPAMRRGFTSTQLARVFQSGDEK